jgi:hypothetical protein
MPTVIETSAQSLNSRFVAEGCSIVQTPFGEASLSSSLAPPAYQLPNWLRTKNAHLATRLPDCFQSNVAFFLLVLPALLDGAETAAILP